jgi:Cdc6-like AAA superfamily ATPase
MHLERAFRSLNATKDIFFADINADMGDDRLLKQCQAMVLGTNSTPQVFVFDRDNPEIIREVSGPDQPFRAWGNNVFSFAIPAPEHRGSLDSLSLEFYYSDDELKTESSSGRRLYLSSEFDPISGRHRTIPQLSVGNRNKLPPARSGRIKIVDSEVFDTSGRNLALSKADFAEEVAKPGGSFSAFGHKSFQPILDIISQIIRLSLPHHDVVFGKRPSTPSVIDPSDDAISETFSTLVRISRAVCCLFIATAVKVYEQRLRSTARQDLRKTRGITDILDHHFAQPSLLTIHRLTKLCLHLVDAEAPDELHMLVSMLTATPLLGEVGTLLDALDQCFPQPRRVGRTIQKHLTRKPVLDFLIAEIARHEPHVLQLRDSPRYGEATTLCPPDLCSRSLQAMQQIFADLSRLTFRTTKVTGISPDRGEFTAAITEYADNTISVFESRQALQPITEVGGELHELALADPDIGRIIDLYPFATISNGSLESYVKTTVGVVSGFQYEGIYTGTGHFAVTRRKFAHAAFRTSVIDLQPLFWSHVDPVVNARGIRANIPLQEAIVGRQKQLLDVFEEILLIPNQNGILYGPGGVGKTALLIEVTRQMFEEDLTGDIFKNIIWVSAKENFFDVVRSEIEIGQPSFTSLEHILAAIMDFHELEDPGGYSIDEQKGLIIELARDSSTLLILDNFESIAPAKQSEILRFFGLDIKKALRDKPENFKVIITSRETIPSNFHQISLRGLDFGESKDLMARLDVPYTHSPQPPLTEDQKCAIYEASRGIPLVIKHCYGQIFEYCQPVEMVIRGLTNATSKLVEYSFSEIIKLLSKDEHHLSVLLLLEVCVKPLLLRQIIDVLRSNELDTAAAISRLVAFHCVVKLTSGQDEKYTVADEARIFARRLILSHPDLTSKLKRAVGSLATEKQLDYSREEEEIVVSFRQYLGQRKYLVGEELLTAELRRRPESVLLNMEYARYLRDHKDRVREALDRLDGVRTKSANQLPILREMVACYLKLDPPDYEQGQPYAAALEELSPQQAEIKLELARYYTAWSTHIMIRPPELDPNRELLRQQRYKELADTSISYLSSLRNVSHEVSYLTAQCFLNKWDYEPAAQHIAKAISLLPVVSHLRPPYLRLQEDVARRKLQYSRDSRR